MVRMHVNLVPADVARIDALVGEKGRSKFIREAVSQQLDHIGSGDAEPKPPFLEYAGRHEPRLTPSGRSVLLDRIQKDGSLDKMMTGLGYDDPMMLRPSVRQRNVRPAASAWDETRRRQRLRAPDKPRNVCLMHISP